MKLMLLFQLMIFLFLSIFNLFINMIPSYNKFIHPMMMGLILLMLLMFSSLNIELYSYLNWISYLMFLIIIGGLMIIFLYFTSFISNMKMSFKFKFLISIPLKFFFMILFIILMLLYLYMYYCWYNLNYELFNFLNMFTLKFYSLYIYLYNKNYSMIFCMIYLLLMLMFIVKICINKKMSLRKIN